MGRPVTSSLSGISSARSALPFTHIDPEWDGEIAVCLGSGPSLTADDALYCRDQGAKILAVNDAVWLAPWADVLYAADSAWWKQWTATPNIGLPPRLLTVDPLARDYRPSVQLLNYITGTGLSLDSSTVMTGGHSGYQAINVAAHYSPRRIVLLGYDMQPSPTGDHHFFGNHLDGRHVRYAERLPAFATLRAPLAALGIEIVNASRVSAITAFPRVSLAEALSV